MRADATRTLVRLMTWLTAAMPTGAFAYSSGLESAIGEGRVGDRGELERWLGATLLHGAPRNDAALLLATMRTPNEADAIAALARALAGSPPRLEETLAQGDAFLDASSAWIAEPAPARRPARSCPLPVAVGWAAAHGGLPREEVAAAYLHGIVANQVQAALRLMPLGQSGAARVMAALEGPIVDAAARAAHATLDDLGTCALGAEIAAMRHETLPARMFRS